MKLQIVGGGKMGQALLHGLVPSLGADEIGVVEPNADARAAIAADNPDVRQLDEAVEGVPTVLAVKPYLAVDVVRSLPPVPRLLSICAGVTTEAIEAVTDAHVIRCMPNTPALVGSGAAAVAAGSSADDDDLEWAVGLLSAVGIAVPLTEPQLDAVTGLAGSGPAYVFLVAEAMTDAGVHAGLPRPIAQRLAYQTIAGAGAMLVADGADAVVLRANVTTPAGTTAAGLAELEKHGVRAAFDAAVAAAAARSRELGE